MRRNVEILTRACKPMYHGTKFCILVVRKGDSNWGLKLPWQTLCNIRQSMTRSPLHICWLIERPGLDSLCTKLKFTFHEKSRKEGEGREMEKYIVISNVWGWWRLEEIKNGRPILNIYTFSSAGEKRTASKNVQTVPDRIDERETRRSAGSECQTIFGLREEA